MATTSQSSEDMLAEVQAAFTGRMGGSLRDHTGPIHD